MKEKFESDYLNSKLEPKLSEEEVFSLERKEKELEKSNNLNRYLFEHSYNEGGIIEHTEGETRVRLEYSTPTLEEFRLGLRRSGLEKFPPPFANARKLNSLIIENKTGHFDSSELIENNGWNIYFQTEMKDWENDKSCNAFKTIILDHDPLTVKGILMLFHEMGHAKNDKKKSKKNIKDFYKSKEKLYSHDSIFSKAKEKDAESYILEERNAWASGLHDLKPFLKDFQIELEEVTWNVHSRCLQSYSDFIHTRFDKKN